jgi:3D (Asp-Asp-Asp) domain-containing protein
MRHPPKIHVGGHPKPNGWELGLLLTMLIVGCVAFGVIYKKPGAEPTLWATAGGVTAQSSSTPAVTNAVQPLRANSIDDAISGMLPKLPGSGLTTPSLAFPMMDSPIADGPKISLRPAIEKSRQDVTYYKGEKYVYWKTITMRVTAYAPDKECCWPFDGTTTASGLSVRTNHGRLVAADTRVIPFHSLVSIDGYHEATPVPVLDRGGAIKGKRLDVLMPTFGSAKDWGSRLVAVKVYRPAT